MTHRFLFAGSCAALVLSATVAVSQDAANAPPGKASAATPDAASDLQAQEAASAPVEDVTGDESGEAVPGAQDAPNAPDAPNTVAAPDEDPLDGEILAAVNAYLNDLRTLRSRFFQLALAPNTGESHTAAGEMHMSRPGLLRFAYDPPQEDPDLIVSDGSVVYMRHAGLNCVEEISLRATPLQVLLKDDVDLARDADVTGLVASETGIVVTLRDVAGEMEYSLALLFSPMPYPELRAWAVTDEFGQMVETRLVEAVPGETFDRRMFRPGNDWPRARDGGFKNCAG